MANKLYAMEQLTEEVAKDVAASPQEWMRFLDTASRLYKYTFPEQLLIYAQRPEATAVASMEIWNQKMFRWIKKGSKGIALIDNTSGPKIKLRYVFDVQDTYKVRNLGKDPQLWNLPMEGEQLVADYLQEQLSLEDTEGLRHLSATVVAMLSRREVSLGQNFVGAEDWFTKTTRNFRFRTYISSHNIKNAIKSLYLINANTNSGNYTRRRFGGRQPLCGNGVTSTISVTSIPALCTARIADSRPLPGPLT